MKASAPVHGEVTLSEEEGVRYLHFGTEWVQGAMRIARPYALELEYQRQMMAALLFVPDPVDVLQLGLGAAALTKFCHRHLRHSRVAVVEINPDVIRVARASFALPADDARLKVIRGDAGDFVRSVPASVDLLQVDLYDARARGPVLDSVDFYSACRGALRTGGVAAFNLFGSSLAPSLERLETGFGRDWLRLPRSAAGNVVVLAGVHLDDAAVAQAVRQRAGELERLHGWPVVDWVAGARSASGRLWQ